MNEVNRQFCLKARPQDSRVSGDNFTYVERPVPEPGPNQALVRTLYLSLDPTQRLWMTDMEQYMPPVAIGEVMRGGGIGQVVASRHAGLPAGALVSGIMGWQDFSLAGDNDVIMLPAAGDIPLETFAGALGVTGFTAYFGLTDLAKPQAGETLVVSAAAGAVGSIVGQIGKIMGCHVVGIAGTDDKCNWLVQEIGFDAAVNYKHSDWQNALLAACPRGIDINFENVGGEIMDFVLRKMNLHGRVVLCGLISGYTRKGGMLGDFSPVLMRRLQVHGFIILDYVSRFKEAAQVLGGWLAEGKIKHRETVVHGLEKAPEALNMLFTGANTGKLMIEVAKPQAAT